MSNPAFRNEAFHREATIEQLEAQYAAPAYVRPSDEVMTVEDTVHKSIAAFGVLLLGAAVGVGLIWFAPAVAMPAIVGAGLAGFVLGLVNAFKKEPSAPLVLAYAGLEGVLLGGISSLLEQSLPGIVGQAVLATLCVVGVTLALFASGKVRASAKATKVFLVAMVGYAIFSLVNGVLMLTGANDDPWGLRSSVTIMGIPLGVVLGILAVLMGAYSLVLDFDFIKRGVENRAPRKFGWAGAFGLMTTIVWLYIELIRLIAIIRR